MDGILVVAAHGSVFFVWNLAIFSLQWADTDGLENHRSPDNVNTQLFIKNVPPMLDGEMEVSEAPMVHYSLKE